jgi:uncharacterized protein with HEPN domain
MSTRGWRFRIEDILEAIGRIQEYSAGLDFSAWQQDQKTVDAVVCNYCAFGLSTIIFDSLGEDKRIPEVTVVTC